MKLLEVRDLRAGYGGADILSGISFDVQAHELVGILGANGSGKTTMLKAMCALLPSSGSVSLCGQDIRRLSPRKMAQLSRYIPQRTGIAMDIPVLDVVLMGFNPSLGLLESPNADMERRAMDALRRVGMAHRAADNFQSLSEGQKQLCLLARTMLLEQGMLFLDEPESALDFSGRYAMLRLVRSWLQSSESGAVVTLHDPQLALNTCDRLLLVRSGQLFADLTPAAEPIMQMEEKLSGIFGALSVHRCLTRSGTEQFVLLKEG